MFSNECSSDEHYYIHLNSVTAFYSVIGITRNNIMFKVIYFFIVTFWCEIWPRPVLGKYHHILSHLVGLCYLSCFLSGLMSLFICIVNCSTRTRQFLARGTPSGSLSWQKPWKLSPKKEPMPFTLEKSPGTWYRTSKREVWTVCI